MSLDKRKLKKEIIDLLRDAPFINHVMKKVGVSRMTFYRWVHDDKTFSYNVRAALQEGHKNMIEVTESALFKKIRSEHFGAIKFYLENNHGNYMNRRYAPRTATDRIEEDAPNNVYSRIPSTLVLDDDQTEQMEHLYEVAEAHNYSKDEIHMFTQMIKDGTFEQYLNEIRNRYKPM
jgi:hypothetical protein